MTYGSTCTTATSGCREATALTVSMVGPQVPDWQKAGVTKAMMAGCPASMTSAMDRSWNRGSGAGSEEMADRSPSTSAAVGESTRGAGAPMAGVPVVARTS